MGLSSADVVVIGGGIIGTASAYYLAKSGLSVELVERKGIAHETSSASEGGVLLQTKAPGPKLAMATESVRLYQQLEEELGCDLELHIDGGMITALDQTELDYVTNTVNKMRADGVPVELLDNKSAREIQPALTPELLASSYCPLDGHVNPLQVSNALASAARRLGARIRVRTEVTGIETQGGRVTSVLTSQGRIATGTVVNAAGIWAPAVAQMVGQELAVIPRRGHILVSERIAPLVRGTIIGARYLMSKLGKPDSGDGGAQSSYSSGMLIGQQPSGNLLIGATREYVGTDRSVTHEAIIDLAKQLVQLIPATRNVQLLRAFSGLRPATPDGAPVIKRYSEPEGFVVAAGLEGDGICLAPITGKIVANIVAGRIDDYHQFELLTGSL